MYRSMLCQDCQRTFEGWHNRVRCPTCAVAPTKRPAGERRRVPIPAIYATSARLMAAQLGQPARLGQRPPSRTNR